MRPGISPTGAPTVDISGSPSQSSTTPRPSGNAMLYCMHRYINQCGISQTT